MSNEELRDHLDGEIEKAKLEILSKVKDDFVAKEDCEKEMTEDDTEIRFLKDEVADLRDKVTEGVTKLNWLIGILSAIGIEVLGVLVGLIIKG